MLSHLRFHRRAPSNPTSPIPENIPWESASLQSAQLAPEDGMLSTLETRPRTSNSAPQVAHGNSHGQLQSPPQSSPQAPPQPQQPPLVPSPSLAPIARVASSESEIAIKVGSLDSRQREEPVPVIRSTYNGESGFMGGLALQNFRRGQQEAMRPSSSDGRSMLSNMSGVTSPPNRQPTKPNTTASSFVAPTDLHSAGPTGKRPPGARMHTDPQGLSVQTLAQEPTKSKKGLPFLKNPMSTLLLRRKTGQNVPDLSLPLHKADGGEPSYQPIRGTRVHDFSAPRPRRIVSSNDVASIAIEKPLPDSLPPPIEEKESGSPGKPPPPVPPKDAQATSIRTSSSIHSRTKSVDAVAHIAKDSLNNLSNASSTRDRDENRRKSSVPSSISTLSRNVSVISRKELLSSLPQHMKSTSSRFSFDMLGAAKAEKLLEDRHRQKQQDKKPGSIAQRDSRFDDFDEDGFDYDAMDFDEGLEEAIPGVNVDYDEVEELGGYDEGVESGGYNEEVEFGGYIEDDGLKLEADPDNDQENFAGFVFQRSNTASALTSPHINLDKIPTPRDVDGNVIGFAMSKESPEANRHSSASLVNTTAPISPVYDSPTGLGIQGLDAVTEGHDRLSMQQNQQAEKSTPRYLDRDDELYFGGLGHEFEGEGDGTAIDESLFDLDDTDQYGRPIPGMFANAVAATMAISQDSKKRESDDVTSRLSAQSGLSQSTAHTSLSVGPPQDSRPKEVQDEKTSPDEVIAPLPGLSATEQEKMAAYQAALAAAAHEAAASGKFRRDSSPPPPTDVNIISPTTIDSEQSNNNVDDLADYEYGDDFSNGLDDYELDDDAIVAEANASALANDSDGWYGQEFGFYLAPAHVPHPGANALSEQNLFQYSSGGYFGPSGVARTKSGHLVSREPNLTPITERSEYSNRNSIMSLQMPNSGNRDTSLNSPGLAQLAMMADDDNMSLSALLRLRSKAWGGSQVSLASSREGSPSERNGASSPWGQDSREMPGPAPGRGRKNSAFSLWSQDSGAGSGAGSPTLTMSLAGIPNSAIPPLSAASGSNHSPASAALPAPLFSPPSTTFPPVLEDEEIDLNSPDMPSSGMGTKPWPPPDQMSPTVGVPSQRRPGMGHRHNGSADSVSYVKEEDSWVMERRRTGESGEIEILGRQVVEGGRI